MKYAEKMINIITNAKNTAVIVATFSFFRLIYTNMTKCKSFCAIRGLFNA